MGRSGPALGGGRGPSGPGPGPPSSVAAMTAPTLEDRVAHLERLVSLLVPAEPPGVLDRVAEAEKSIGRLLGHFHSMGGAPGAVLPALPGYLSAEDVPPGPGEVLHVGPGGFSTVAVRPPGSEGAYLAPTVAVVVLGPGYHRIHPSTTVSDQVKAASGWDGDWDRVGLQPYGGADQMAARWPAAPLEPEEG